MQQSAPKLLDGVGEYDADATQEQHHDAADGGVARPLVLQLVYPLLMLIIGFEKRLHLCLKSPNVFEASAVRHGILGYFGG